MARVEGKTFICTKERYDAVPHVAEGVQGHLAKWLGLADLSKELDTRMPGCMAGRTMYVIPFSMGPLTSPLAKYCIELTDSPYVMINMIIMTRVSTDVFAAIEKAKGEFVRAVHSVGCPEYDHRILCVPWIYMYNSLSASRHLLAYEQAGDA